MPCAAYAAMRAADYPEAVRVYDQRLPPRSYEEADLAALGLLWRHRSEYAAAVAARAASPAPADDLRPGQRPEQRTGDERSHWIGRLTDISAAQREAVADSCQSLYDEADRSCPSAIGFQPAR
jgi:hypothetical protein